MIYIVYPPTFVFMCFERVVYWGYRGGLRVSDGDGDEFRVRDRANIRARGGFYFTCYSPS